MPNQKLANRVGDIDALVFLIFWTCIGMLFSTHWYGALPVIVLFLVPASVIVGMRGRVSVYKILSGYATWKAATLEGATCGLTYTLLFFVLAAAKETWAAGTVFMGQSPGTLEFWLTAVTAATPPLLFGAFAGAATGNALLMLNRRLVTRLTQCGNFQIP
jgi:Na+-translocating ferredoxin:NAD+ oxidoreductase RnfE subunit